MQKVYVCVIRKRREKDFFSSIAACSQTEHVRRKFARVVYPRAEAAEQEKYATRITLCVCACTKRKPESQPFTLPQLRFVNCKVNKVTKAFGATLESEVLNKFSYLLSPFSRDRVRFFDYLAIY